MPKVDCLHMSVKAIGSRRLCVWNCFQNWMKGILQSATSVAIAFVWLLLLLWCFFDFLEWHRLWSTPRWLHCIFEIHFNLNTNFLWKCTHYKYKHTHTHTGTCTHMYVRASGRNNPPTVDHVLNVICGCFMADADANDGSQTLLSSLHQKLQYIHRRERGGESERDQHYKRC